MSLKVIVFVMVGVSIQVLCMAQNAVDRYVFCAGSTGCIDVTPPKNESKPGGKLQMISAPEGAKLFADEGIFTWTPSEKQLGEHVVKIQTSAGEKTLNIEVKPLKRAIFIFAHGDDEFCIMPRLKQLVDQGVEVWCVWTYIPGKMRMEESTAAMTKLGVPKERLLAVNFRSMDNGKDFAKLVDWLADIIKQHDFQQIYANAYEGGHMHHDLDHVAAVEAASAAGFHGQIYEFGLYNLYGGKPHVFELIPAAMPYNELVMDEAGVKYVESLVALYPSQKQVTSLFLYGMTPEQKSHTRYRTSPNWDFTRRPYKGAMKYEFGLVGHENLKQKFSDYRKIVTDYYALKGQKPSKQAVYEQDKTADMKKLSGTQASPPQQVVIK